MPLPKPVVGGGFDEIQMSVHFINHGCRGFLPLSLSNPNNNDNLRSLVNNSPVVRVRMRLGFGYTCPLEEHPTCLGTLSQQ
jgi:hypothetical protein